MSVILEGKQVTKAFGGVKAVNNVDFDLQKGEILGLIGPNGAGKTTLLNCISGTFPLTTGEIIFNGKKTSDLKTFEIARLGIGRTFQVVRPFEGMTIRENVTIGAYFGKTRALNSNPKQASELVDRILEKVKLADQKNKLTTELTIAYRKRLELARALAMEPEVLLLDEVMAGLNAKEIETTMEIVQDINKEGITVVMIEHVMKAIMGICHRIMVLRWGEKIALGTPEEIVNNELVIQAYLGERYTAYQKGRVS
ncbi:MAG TPA: ABC transporter ATP-binding protein [Clostridia bacterium]|nr:ABC transporter ATP-binding protein [Clostridia bacterium]